MPPNCRCLGLLRQWRWAVACRQDWAHGLAALLGSRLIDSFFRIQSGNTQVSATEIRALPLPPAAQIREIGAAVLAAPGVADQESVERWMRGLGLSG